MLKNKNRAKDRRDARFQRLAIALIQQWNQPGDHKLEKLIVKLLAGSSVPTGILLLGCAFNEAWIPKLNDLGTYLAAAGVALLFISIKEIVKQ